MQVTQLSTVALPTLNQTTSRAIDWRNAFLCALAVAVTVLASWPMVELSFDDDWSYAFTTKRLLESGHMELNGWATTAVGVQAYWGALFCRIFGFSIVHLRMSILLLGCAGAAIAYALARRCGLKPQFALLTAMTLAISPVYVPLAASYMTDCAGVLFTLASLYCLMSAALSTDKRTVIAWTIVGAAIGSIGGTARQTVAFVPLTILPYLAWIRRDQFAVVITAVVCWVLVVAGSIATVRWFASVPYSIPEKLGETWKALHGSFGQRKAFWNFVGLLLTLALISMPVLLIIATRWRTRNWKSLLVIVAMMAILLRRAHAVAPWLSNIGNMLHKCGLLGWLDRPAGHFFFLPHKVWIIVSLATLLTLAMVISMAFDLLMARVQRQPAHWAKARWLWAPGPRQMVGVPLALFMTAYALILIPRCALDRQYDRYLLPLIPCVAIPLLLWFQKKSDRVPAVAWIVVAIFGVFSVLETQEYWAAAAARLAAANQLVSNGVPRLEIDAGGEWASWWQLEKTGHVNDPRIQNPPNGYDKTKPPLPDFHPRYITAYVGTRMWVDQRATSYPPIQFTTFWPPIHRALEIRQIVPHPESTK